MHKTPDQLEGEIARFAERLKDIRPHLAKELARRGVSPCDRDDIIQQALLELLKRQALLAPLPPDELKAYARRAVLYWLFKTYRTSTRRLRREQQWAGVEAAGRPGPEELCARAQALSHCAAWLNRLPDQLYVVLVARTVDGLSTSEAADKLGLPLGTVKTRLLKAREMLEHWRDLQGGA